MNKILIIALNTCRESLRSKVLYSLFFFAIILVAVSALFGSVTIGDQVKVIKDFGLFAISLFSVTYAVIAGSTLLNKELSGKTVYNILSRPVHRGEFLIGKYLGMLATIIIMLLLMGAGFSLFVFLFEWQFNLALLHAYLHILFELIIVCAATIFFSSIVVTPMLSGLFTLGLFLAGRSTSFLLYFTSEEANSGPVLKYLLEALYYLLPHFDQISIINQVVYDKAVPFMQSFWALIYALGYASILLVLASFLFKRREFN